MSHYKGTIIVTVKQIIQSKGPDVEKKILDQISEEERNDYLSTHVLHWVTNRYNPTDEKAFLSIAAKELYPEHPHPVQCLGKESANVAINGIYKFLFRFPTFSYLIKHAPKFWRVYNDKGVACIENFVKDQKHISADFVVRKYPDMQKVVREFLAGYVSAVMEWIGARYVDVQTNDNYSEESGWRWSVDINF